MSEKMCYAASNDKHPGYYAVSVDEPTHPKETAKFVATCIREGGKVTRVTADEARRGLQEYWDAKQKAKLL